MLPATLLRSAAIGLVAMAGSLPAQSFYVPNANPRGVANNAFPFNTSDMRYQALVTAADLGSLPALITGFALQPASTGVRTFTQVTMKMAHLSSPTLSTTFDQNLAAGAITTMDVANWSWYLTADTWTEVDMQVPFFFNGVDNVVVEFTVYGGSGAAGGMWREGTHPRLYLGNYTGQPTGTLSNNSAFKMRFLVGDAGLGRFGQGCAGSNQLTPALSFSGSSQLGQTLTYELTNAFASTPAFLTVGFWIGFPFPLDLAPYGMPGCTAYVPSLAISTAVTDPAGAGSLQLQIPNNAALTGLFYYAQWFPLDLTSGTLTASNYGRILVGN